MPASYDLSTMKLDEIEEAVNLYDPYSPAEPAGFEQDKREPLPDELTLEQVKRLEFMRKSPDELSLKEIFKAPALNVLDKSMYLTVKTGAAVEKGIWKALGVLSWPFMRIEHGIATPATALVKTAAPMIDAAIKYVEMDSPAAQARMKWLIKQNLGPYVKEQLGDNLDAVIDDIVEKNYAGVDLSQQLSRSRTAAEDIIPSFGTGLKSFIPFTRTDTEKVKNFNDFWAGYYEGMTNERCPELYSQVMGPTTSFLVTPLAVAKFLKVGRAAWRMTPMAKKIAASKLPAWEDAKLIRKATIFERNEKAMELGAKLADKEAQRIANQLSVQTGKNITKEAVKQRLGQIIKGSITQQEELAALSNPVIDELSYNFKELQKLGIIGPETFLTKLSKAGYAKIQAARTKLTGQLERLQTAPHYIRKGGEISARFPGRAEKIKKLQEQIAAIDRRLYESDIAAGGAKYMPRMYEPKEAAAAERKFPVKGGPKIKAPYAKQREAIPVEIRKAMGEIVEPAYPVTKRLIQENIDIETKKLFDFAAKRGDWVDDIWREGLYKEPLPDTKAFGALRGKYVKPKIYHDIKDITYIRGNIEQIYDSFIGTWKLGKVTLNPATHFRNIMSNTILLDASGMDHAAQVKYFTKAIKEIRSAGKEYQQAKKYLQRTSMVSGEILDDMLKVSAKQSNVSGIVNAWNKGFEKTIAIPANLYQNEEFIFKFMKYLEQREKGISVLGAVKEANKWLFDYGDLSRFEKTVMRRVMPFYTFPRKALPRIMEAAVERPYTLAKYPLMVSAIEKYSLWSLGLDENDYEQIQKVLPDYMKRGSYLLMPWRDANGDLQFFDWTYIVPWGELFDVQDRGLIGDVVTNPIYVLMAENMLNKNGFIGYEIYQETDTVKERTFKQMLHVWQTLVPSLMYKGIYWDRIYSAATGKPSRGIFYDKIPPLAPAIAHTVFGLRTQPIDIEEEKIRRLRELRGKVDELGDKIRRLTLKESGGAIEKDEYEKKRGQYLKQIDELLEKETD